MVTWSWKSSNPCKAAAWGQGCSPKVQLEITTQLCQLPSWMVMNTREPASSAGESLQIQQDPLLAQPSLLTVPSLNEILHLNSFLLKKRDATDPDSTFQSKTLVEKKCDVSPRVSRGRQTWRKERKSVTFISSVSKTDICNYCFLI